MVEIGGLRYRRQIATVPHLLPLSPISQIATPPAPRRRCGRTADATATCRRLAAAVTCCCSAQRHHLAVQHLTAQGACSESPSFLRHTDSGDRALDLLDFLGQLAYNYEGLVGNGFERIYRIANGV
ncbi:hypothetical protein AAHA92_23018 [Salvia divinorum]|uniref:Uncharacterized protein n=1 Tax=Salvia divinorum TaxID=28513 RepID=A0ABD1GQK2_SALDI